MSRLQPVTAHIDPRRNLHGSCRLINRTNPLPLCQIVHAVRKWQLNEYQHVNGRNLDLGEILESVRLEVSLAKMPVNRQIYKTYLY